MSQRARWWLGFGTVLSVVAGLALVQNLSAEGKKSSGPSDEAVQRTRKQVRMLDDIYKTAVVLITDKYVNDADDFPAGSAAVALFAAIKDKGWHDAQLLDVTGQPFAEKNVADSEFEKSAVAAIRDGKGYFEQVAQIDGKPHLQAATPIPVVSQKCIICHPHYADAKPGQAIGIISYVLPIE